MRTPALSVTLTVCSVALWPIGAGGAAAAPDDGGGTRVPLTPVLRACDFSFQGTNFWGTMPGGQGEVLIRTSGNTVIAEVQFVNSKDRGAHYDVGLIQAPRPANSPCGPGAPDTAYTGMDVDPAGRAAVTLQDTLRPGTTGVWVKIQRPSPHSQFPAEFYTTSYLAKV